MGGAWLTGGLHALATETGWDPASADWIPVWSPDSKWLAYSKRLPNYLGAVYAYSLATGKATQITDGMSDAKYPVFDREGKYLYFAASTDSGPSLQPDVGSFTRPVTRSIYIVVLAKDQPSPFAPESDEEKPGEPRAADSSATGGGRGGRGGAGGAAAAPEAPPKPVRIDFDKIQQRIVAMPVPARQYYGLAAGRAKVSTGYIQSRETPP